MEVHKKDPKSYLLNLILLIALIFSILSLYLSVRTSDQINELDSVVSEYSSNASNHDLEELVFALKQDYKKIEQLNLEQSKEIERLAKIIQNFEISNRSKPSNKSVERDHLNSNSISNHLTPHQRTYSVQAGDTLSKIASMHRVPLSRLLQSNPSIDPRRLQIGQIVVIPTESSD